MAETVAELLVKVGADIEGLKAGSAEMRAILAKLQQDAGKASSGFSRLQATTISLAAAATLARNAYQLLAGVVSSITSVAGEFADAASDQEDSILQLRNALELTGNASDEVVSAFDAQASAMQQISRFSDETVTAVQAMLTRFGVLPEGMAAATQAVADFAAATGTDLASAAETVGRAIEGQVRGLRAYGITLEDTGSKSQNLANAIEAIENRFGGAALASVQNMRGALIVLGNAFGEVQETLGGFLTQSEETARVIDFIGTEIASLNSVLKTNETAFQSLVDNGIRDFVLFMVDATAAVLTIGGAFETVGRKVAAFAGVLTLPFKSEGFKQAFADLTSSVETETDKMLAKLADFRARFEAFGGDTPKQIGDVGAAIGEIAPAADRAAASVGTLTTASTNLANVADPTAAALERQEDALAKMDETLADLDFEAATAGLSPLQTKIAEVGEEFRRTGEEAGVSLDVISEKTAEAAEKAQRAFSKDLFGDYKQALSEISAESEVWALTTGRNATEQERLDQAVAAASDRVQAAAAAYLSARQNTGEFSETTLVAKNNLALANGELERARASAEALRSPLKSVAQAFAEMGAAAEQVVLFSGRGLKNALNEVTGLGDSFTLGIDERPFQEQLRELQEAGASADEFRALAEAAAEASNSVTVDTRALTEFSDAGGLNRFLQTNKVSLEQVAAAAEAAALAIERFGSASSALATPGVITIPIMATGSPTLPISEYFDSYLPKKIANADLEPAPLVIRTQVAAPTTLAGDSASSGRRSLNGGGGDDEMMRQNNEHLERIAGSLETVAAASSQTASEITGDRYAARMMRKQEKVVRGRGNRLFGFDRL